MMEDEERQIKDQQEMKLLDEFLGSYDIDPSTEQAIREKMFQIFDADPIARPEHAQQLIHVNVIPMLKDVPLKSARKAQPDRPHAA